MAYLTSRPEGIPSSPQKMQRYTWYNMWKTKRWPYNEILPGDLVCWYERSRDAVVWHTHVVKIERFHYPKKSEAARIIERRFGHHVDRSEDYYQTRPARGFCVAFSVKTGKRLNLRKPRTLKFSRLGWQRVNAEIASKWLRV